MSNQFENDEMLDGLVPEHQEKGGFDLGAFAAELTTGSAAEKLPTAQEIWAQETAKPADEADEYVDPDALPEDYDEVKVWEEANHAAMLAKGLDDKGEPLVERDPAEVDREIEADAVRRAQEVARPVTSVFNALLSQQISAQESMLEALAAEIPDMSEDPERHIATSLALLEAKTAVRDQTRALEQQGAAFEKDVNEALPYGLAQEAKFKAQCPDYSEALDHLHGAIAQQMKAKYPGITDAAIGQTQALAALKHMQACKANGENPAEALYNTALRFGFRGQGAVAPAPRPQGKPTPTLEDVARMDDAEFEAFFSEVQRGGTVQPAFGGGAKR
ncbi:MAG: hypothetical protein I8H93_10690 [Pseudomonadales bacterium]|nr:hypothetical protein [Pseudomonadales bacterium]